MLKIWGRLNSINVRKVVFAAQCAGVPFERIDAGMAFGIVKTPEFMAKNPNAMIPLIEDGEVMLWESNVIVRYLCARHAPGELYPTELAVRFDAERWMDWQQTALNRASSDAFVQLVRVPAAQRSQALIDASFAATERHLELLDAHLARSAFMAGERFTMADIPIACEIDRWWSTPLPQHPPHAHLRRWFDQVMALPAARGVLGLPPS